MRFVKTLPFILALTVLSAGCAGMYNKLDKDAFGGKKRYALVSVYGPAEIQPRQEGRTLSGMIAALSKTKGYSADAVPTMTRSVKGIEAALDRARGFRLVPSSQIVKSASYKRAKGEEVKIALWSLPPAKGFKTFGDNTKGELSRIIAENQLDGAIFVTLSYSHGTSGITVGGIGGVGKTYGYVNLTIIAVDRKGNPVWQQNISKESAEGSFTMTGAADFTKLEPMLVATTQKGVEDAVKALDQELASN